MTTLDHLHAIASAADQYVSAKELELSEDEIALRYSRLFDELAAFGEFTAPEGQNDG